ncbi:MAG: Ig-like domain-containing protein, partial [Candidatus Binataceae bacterium]
MSRASRPTRRLLIGLASVVSLALYGCGQGGSGGGSPANSQLSPNAVPILAAAANPSTVVISSTAAASTTVHAEVLNPANDLPLIGVPVSFSTSEGSLASSTESTDANGSANNTLFIAAGASGSSADVTVSAQGATRKLTIPIVSLANIELSATPNTLQCSNGNPGLSVIQALALDASNNPLGNVPITFTPSGGATLASTVATTNSSGQANITATAPLGLPNGNISVGAQAAGISASITLAVSGCVGSSGPTPTPESVLQFISANPAQIGVLQSGQAQQSALTFKLTDLTGTPIPGVSVEFFVASLGGESVSPASAVTQSDGTVQTELTAGTRATVVQVTAETGSTVAISTPVTIVGGLPVQGRVSAGAQFLNVAGNVTQGLMDPITVLMSDRFSNPVAPGTAISLQSLGGAVSIPSTSDDNGVVTANLIAEAPTNPVDLDGVPTGGVVTILAFTYGETPFIDLYGTGVYQSGDPVIPVPEPFFDLNGDGVREANEPFIDLDGTGKYNSDQSNGLFSQHVVVFTSTRVTFSGAPVARITPPSGFTVPFGGSQTFLLTTSRQFRESVGVRQFLSGGIGPRRDGVRRLRHGAGWRK